MSALDEIRALMAREAALVAELTAVRAQLAPLRTVLRVPGAPRQSGFAARLRTWIAGQAEPFGAAEAARACGARQGTVSVVLHRALEAGTVRRVGHGLYQRAEVSQ